MTSALRLRTEQVLELPRQNSVEVIPRRYLLRQAVGKRERGRMEPVSRRSFFKQAGAVAATAGTMAVAPIGLANIASGATLATASNDHDAPLTPEEHLRGDEQLIAHVKNARTGEIS